MATGCDPMTVVRAASDVEILRCVQLAISRYSVPPTCQERRREKRHPFPYPVVLLPVDRNDHPTGERLAALGKHISHHGLDFYYRTPIEHRRVIARFDARQSVPVELLMDLTWCRFSGHGWYINGGRFLAAVSWPSATLVAATTDANGERTAERP